MEKNEINFHHFINFYHFLTMISFYWSLFLLFFQQFQFESINIIHNSKFSNSIILTCDLIFNFITSFQTRLFVPSFPFLSFHLSYSILFYSNLFSSSPVFQLYFISLHLLFISFITFHFLPFQKMNKTEIKDRIK